MVRNGNDEHRWSVILAGGDGTRLLPLTRLISGDDRPKQFCPLLEDMTLLGRTRLRIEPHFAASRTLFVLTAAHERYYREEMVNVQPRQMLVQPLNCGTLPAILWSLIRITEMDSEAVVAFFPSGHNYSDEIGFMAGVNMACQAAESGSPYVTLLGVPARHAECGYGWIEAEASTSRHSTVPLLRVKRFWEKPSASLARQLLDQGCVWNTFVMAGRARGFLDVIAAAAPALYGAFQEEDIGGLYESLAVADFSKRILTASTERLAVLCLGDVGWSDLGEPQRVIRALSENGLESPGVALWRRAGAGRESEMGFRHGTNAVLSAPSSKTRAHAAEAVCAAGA